MYGYSNPKLSNWVFDGKIHLFKNKKMKKHNKNKKIKKK